MENPLTEGALRFGVYLPPFGPFGDPAVLVDLALLLTCAAAGPPVAATTFASRESDVDCQPQRAKRDDIRVAEQLAPEEPEAGPWRAKRLAAVIESLSRLGTAAHTDDRSVVLAVDGRSSSGKTILAARVQAVVAGSAVVHTDDLAWWHSRFGWADLLIEGILMPVHQGQPVSFRPPRWAEHGREGSIDVPASCPLLIIEGVGAGRREAAHLVGALIWVQSDQAEAERRSVARVGQPGGPRTVRDLREWMAEEEPFLADQRPWERANLVVAGTPQIPFDPLTELVVAQRPSGTAKT
jgi:hypothetical protein